MGHKWWLGAFFFGRPILQGLRYFQGGLYLNNVFDVSHEKTFLQVLSIILRLCKNRDPSNSIL